MTTQRLDIPGVIAPPPLLFVAVIGIGLLLDWLFPAYVLYVLLPTWLRAILAIACLAASIVLALPAIFGFRAEGTHVEPWKPSSALVTRGIYARLRNPMYVGLTLLLVGLAVLLASDWMLVLTVFFAVVMHYGVVLREERYLEAKFGDVYRKYKAAVSRYGIPF